MVSPLLDSRRVIASRAALELKDGEVTNLGAGIPMLMTSHLPETVQVTIQTENGMVMAGPSQVQA